MYAPVRRLLVLLLVLAPLSAVASSEWQQPTADELKMTSYPADPNAPAVYLFREEIVNDDQSLHYLYARVKILTEKGKEMFGDIEVPYEASGFKIDEIEGHTIHSDGTVIPFTGKPYDKLLVKEGKERLMAKVFSMPDVQVGSIIEYRYRLRYNSSWRLPPDWRIQQQVPVLKAHYNFVPSSSPMASYNAFLSDQISYSLRLPTKDNVVKEKNGSYDLTVANIPALPDENYLPPFANYGYRVIFYYTSGFNTSGQFWKAFGGSWSEGFDEFAHVSGKIRDAVNSIVAPGDSDEQKVEKIYAAVMKLENTSFTREHSAMENKEEHEKVNSAQDIWAQQRGNDDEITMLFVAMVRAAGIKAYGAVVVDRDENVFDPNYLSWSQMDDDLAIVSISGKEVYLDPGQRYCEFGKLHWKHTWAEGIRQTGDGTQIFNTPGVASVDNGISRTAQLTLDPDGHVHGFINESMAGAEALAWRQAALTGDEAAIKKQFEDNLKGSMPTGIQVKVDHFVGLTDFTHPLTVVANVTGTLGTQTGKHLFIPAVFFEAGNKPLFVDTERKYSVDMQYPYLVRDNFKLTLPPNITVESLPNAAEVPFSQYAQYDTKFASNAHAFGYGRLLVVAKILYKAEEYPSLRSFFQSVGADDQEQIALTVTPEATAATAPGK